MTSRMIAVALLAAGLVMPAAAAPQLVAPNFNPGLRTVPSVPHTYYAKAAANLCEERLVDRIESGTVISGADGRVAHLTGTATGTLGGEARLLIISTSADGMAATADFVTCMASGPQTAGPVAASLPLDIHGNVRSITVRSQSNTVDLTTAGD